MYEIPVIEKLNNIGIVGDLLSNQQAVRKATQRIQYAQNIEDYLQAEVPTAEQFNLYCEGLTELLEENPRLALYAPLEEIHLDIAPAKLRAAYHRAWRKCWSYIETRSDYTQGDINPNASLREGQQIIKAFHLIPWLLRNGIVQPLVFDEIIEKYSDNPAAMQALSDCTSILKDSEFFNSNSLGRCSEKRIKEIQQLRPPQPDPLADEEGEDEADRWRFKRTVMRTHNRSRIRNATGPFSANVPEIQNKIHVIENTANVDEVILMGGSRLKGYSTYSSDFDAYSYDPSTQKLVDLKPNMNIHAQIPDPAVIHLCFDTIWVGVDPQNVRKAQTDCMNRYLSLGEDLQERSNALLALENDLLKFRLMHKGFPYCYSELSKDCERHRGIDGNSAFYDRRYRSVATILFAKYIHLPQI